MIKYLPIFFLLIGAQLCAQTTNLREEITKIIQYDADLSYDLTPGFVIGISDGDSTYILTFGKEAGKKEVFLDSAAIFETGSVSKAVTSMLVYALDQTGILHIEDKVNSFLGVDVQNPRLNNLTILDLLNHTAPFPRRPQWFGEHEEDPQNPYEFYSKSELLKYYARFVPVKNQTDFNYSHINYAMLEVIIEAATGQSFGDVLEQYICSPLDMRHSFVDFKEKKDNVLAAGVDRSLSAASPWSFNSFSASEGIKSNVPDMLKFLRAMMSQSGTELDALGSKILALEKPSYNEKLYYTSGWHGIRINKKTKALINNGNTNGHSAFIGMVPENKTAVVILSNSAFGTKDLGLLVLRMINYNWKRRPQ